MLRTAAAHVFVADLAEPELDEADAHHLVRVLRVRRGETVTVSDGLGSWRVCEMSDAGALRVVDDTVTSEPPERYPILVAFGVTKSDKPETVVQKLTELGVDHIVPVLLDRSVARWDEAKIDRQHARFRRVAREAAMQSRRLRLPEVHSAFGSLLSLMRSPVMVQCQETTALADPEGSDELNGLTAMVIGPEGGFSREEIELLDRRVRLPGGVLRAETAAIAAGVVLAQARSRL